MDVIVTALQKYSGLPKNMIVGMADIRFIKVYLFFITGIKNPPKNISSFVLGGHGDSMVAMLGSTEVNGKKINELVRKVKFQKKD